MGIQAGEQRHLIVGIKARGDGVESGGGNVEAK